VGKFVFAATVSVLAVSGLVVFGDLLLGLPLVVMACHLGAVLMVALGLAGLNVGLGAYLPNFRETDPSKIVVGFGGTVNMVVGLGYLVIVLGLTMGPLHGAAVANKFRTGLDGLELPWWAFAGLPLAAVVAAAAIVLPLRAGARALNRVEF
jgi:ABC-2 type transport system permease protein